MDAYYGYGMAEARARRGTLVGRVMGLLAFSLLFTAGGAVLDTASIVASTVAIPRDVQAEFCIRSGYLALRRIADFFGIPYEAAPQRGDPIAIARSEFDEVCDRLAAAGVPLKEDRDRSWLDFAGWRVNYDTVLLALAGLTMAPYAPWSSDRGIRTIRPRRFRARPFGPPQA